MRNTVGPRHLNEILASRLERPMVVAQSLYQFSLRNTRNLA